MYLLPGGGIPAWDHSRGGGSARDHPGKFWAWTLVAALLEIHQRFGQIPASPYRELHIPAQVGTLLVLLSSPILNCDSEDSTQITQWGLKYLCRSIKVHRMPCCAAEGTYPPCESLSLQRSSLFWMPEPQDLEHWKRMQAGGTILENELWVCVCDKVSVCLCAWC